METVRWFHQSQDAVYSLFPSSSYLTKWHRTVTETTRGRTKTIQICQNLQKEEAGTDLKPQKLSKKHSGATLVGVVRSTFLWQKQQFLMRCSWDSVTDQTTQRLQQIWSVYRSVFRQEAQKMSHYSDSIKVKHTSVQLQQPVQSSDGLILQLISQKSDPASSSPTAASMQMIGLLT